jgi:CubicO group peptidase (beta-lactamase class C family)
MARPRPSAVTSDNWIEGPYNRWGFLHVRELARTARISHGDAPVRELPSDLRDLESVPIAFEGSTTTFAESLADTYSDGVCVVHDGAIVFEHYADGMDPGDTHLLMSVSKSLTATLVGALAGDGVLDPTRPVTEYVGPLRGTTWEGCLVQHLLDMRAGTRFDEDDYGDADSDGVLIDEVSGYRTLRTPGLPPDTPTWIAGLGNDRAHGSAFKYRSILTDVLAWAAAEAAGKRFPDLFSEVIWSRIGAEHDAEVIVDAAGFAAAEGGLCATLRDLARFGLMHLEDGGGVVPTAWIERLLTRDDELIAEFDSTLLPGLPKAFYHDCWWIWDAEAGIYSGYGINGQQLLVHRPTRTVIARLSTWPTRSDDRLFAFADTANRALIEHLSG